jgi:hypothetical protein
MTFEEMNSEEPEKNIFGEKKHVACFVVKTNSFIELRDCHMRSILDEEIMHRLLN